MIQSDIRGFFFPYCLKQVDEKWILESRQYQQIGVPVKIEGLGIKTLEKLSHDGMVDLNDRIYLYDDGSNPVRSDANMQRYQAKLALLMKLKVVM